MNRQIIKISILFIFIWSVIGCKQSVIEEEILFVKTKKYQSFPAEIILKDVDRNIEKRLFKIKDSFVYGFDWSPDGNKLIFGLTKLKETKINNNTYSKTYVMNSKIYVMKCTNRKYTCLTDGSMEVGGPLWSPDGKKIAFYGNKNTLCKKKDSLGWFSIENTGDIYVMDADGKNQKKITTTSTEDSNYIWTPDSKKLIFESHPNYGNKRFDADFIKYEGNSDIYMVDSDGRNQIKLVNDPTNDRDISLSPDGRKIVYISLCNDNYEIFVMDIDSKNKIRLTNNSIDDWNPTWSPDGKKIAFTSKDCMLYLIDPDGKNQIKLTEINRNISDLITVSSFVWAQDSKRIAFWGSSFNDSYDIYVIDINNKEVKNLTNTPDWDEQWISWRPIVKQ
ncbi:MAG: hypothetical protein AB1414_07495 [bacterium]